MILDEILVYLNLGNSSRSLYYRKRREENIPTWIWQCNKGLTKGFIIVLQCLFQWEIKNTEKWEKMIKVMSSNVKTNLYWSDICLLNLIFIEANPNVFPIAKFHLGKATSHIRKVSLYSLKLKIDTSIKYIYIFNIFRQSASVFHFELLSLWSIKKRSF